MKPRLFIIAVLAGAGLAGAVLLAALVGAAAAGASPHRAPLITSATGGAWSFGVMADTQWTTPDDGKNPNTAAIDIVNQVNRQFIKKHVKFVIEVGDLCDDGSIAGEDTRAVFAQGLYDAGIGFYPLRGNHDGSAAAGNEFVKIYPQTQTAMMNSTPASAFAAPNPDASTQPFPTPSGSPFKVGTISASPAAPAGFAGLCYAFDYNNVRFVLLDQFTPTTGTSHKVLDAAQVDWMNQQLSGRAAGTHAFVFGHKGIITENHTDTLFGNDPSANPTPPAQGLQNLFVSDLQANGVRYCIGGHDHMHNRALVKSPDGSSSIEDIIAQSDSSKFYVPNSPSNDAVYDNPLRETQISQEAVGPTAEGASATVHIGYYIFHVCGPCVTVDYYSAPVTATDSDGEYLIATTPKLCFTRVESFGYSLNGREFTIPEGQSYAGLSDTFRGTTATLLGGTNDGTATDVAGRALTETVDTGWTPACGGFRTQSNVLTLWGLVDLGADQSSTYTLSMSYGRGNGAGWGRLPVLLTRDRCEWVNAVDANVGGHERMVVGPWKPGYKLGTYGVDPSKRIVWAVVNHEGKFAAGPQTDR